MLGEGGQGKLSEKLMFEKRPEEVEELEKSGEEPCRQREQQLGLGIGTALGWPEWQELGGSGRTRRTGSRARSCRLDAIVFTTCWQVLSGRVT